MTFKALAICAPCDGYGVLMNDCGKRCETCHGLGHVLVAITEDDFFRNLPPGMTRDQAKALLARVTGREVCEPEKRWSPYPIGNDKVELARPEPTGIPGAGRISHR